MPPDLSSPGPGGDGKAPSADELWLETWLATAGRRWRAWVAVRSATLAIGVALLTRAATAGLTPASLPIAVTAGVLAGLLLLIASAGLRDWRPVALAAERDTPALRNALIAWKETRSQAPPAITARLASHARQSLASASWPHPHSRRAWATTLAVLLAGALAAVAANVTSRPRVAVAQQTRDAADATKSFALQWTVTVTPPAYTRRPASRVRQPKRIDALAGSRIEFAFAGWPRGGAARLGSTTLSLSGDADTRTTALLASASDVLLIHDARQQVLEAITIVVTPDGPPTVRIMAPAADLRRTTASGVVPIEITAADDIGLRDLRLRFTKVSGSGESFTFEDGEWPVEVRRQSPTRWRGVFRLDLATTGMGPGDSVVYHAVAHDARLGAEGAVESERYLIEITRPGALVAGDFSLPEPEEKFALSQRMVILLTERLLEKRPRMSAEDYAREAQALAMAQRRVRAEFVFMLGGEVEDEFEEAAHAHEVEEGRQANQRQGRSDRGGPPDVTGRDAAHAPSTSEKPFLTSIARWQPLQAAFGKSRYFMRTLPAAVQIDAARRLQGDRTPASSARWTVTPLTDQARADALALLARLDTAQADLDRLLPALVAIDRGGSGVGGRRAARGRRGRRRRRGSRRCARACCPAARRGCACHSRERPPKRERSSAGAETPR